MGLCLNLPFAMDAVGGRTALAGVAAAAAASPAAAASARGGWWSLGVPRRGGFGSALLVGEEERSWGPNRLGSHHLLDRRGRYEAPLAWS